MRIRRNTIEKECNKKIHKTGDRVREGKGTREKGDADTNRDEKSNRTVYEGERKCWRGNGGKGKRNAKKGEVRGKKEVRWEKKGNVGKRYGKISTTATPTTTITPFILKAADRRHKTSG